MYPAVIGFVFAVLNLLLVPSRGDMLMRSKTYNVRATAINKEGKLVNVSGTLMDFKLLMVTSEGEINNDNYTFSILAKEMNDSLDDLDTDYYELNAFSTPNSQMSDSKKLLPYTEKYFGQPKNISPNLPSSSLMKKNLSCESNETQTKFNGTEDVSTAKFDNAPLKNLSPTRFSGFSQLPLFRNISSARVDEAQTPSTMTKDETITPFDSTLPLKNPGLPPKCLQNQLSAGGVVPQTSQLNEAQLYPKPSNDDFNNTIRTGSTDTQVPSQNFHTEQSRQVNMVPHLTPNSNVFDRKNSETCQEHGPKANDMLPYPLRDSIEKAVPMKQVFKVQNLSLTPANNVTSINLTPISGEPWTNLTDENNVTQLYANTPKLNLLLPLQNVSVSGNSSGDNDTIKYASLDAPSLLQKVEPVNDTTITHMVEDYLDNGENNATTIDNMDLMEEIIEEVSDMMSDQTEIDEGPIAEHISTEFPPTMPELVEIVEVIANDDQEIGTESTTWAMTTPMNPTTISFDNATTESNGSVNVSTCTYTTTEKTSSTAKGNTVVSSTLVVLFVAVSILTRTAVIDQ